VSECVREKEGERKRHREGDRGGRGGGMLKERLRVCV